MANGLGGSKVLGELVCREILITEIKMEISLIGGGAKGSASISKRMLGKLS